MNFFWKQIGAFMIAFALLYAIYDFVTFFTEEPYRVEITQCSDDWESRGDIYGPAQVKVMRFKGIYTLNENSYTVDVKQDHNGKSEFCNKYKKVKVWISKYSPTEGRLVGFANDWHRLALSVILFAVGSVIYFAKESLI